MQISTVVTAPTISGTFNAIPSIPTGATEINGGYVKVTAAANIWYTAYTPTGGKTGYITTLSMSSDTAGANAFADNGSGTILTDGAYSGVKFVNQVLAATTVVWTFPKPLKIATALKFASVTATNVTIAFTGYEV